jgi:hypothetical protein
VARNPVRTLGALEAHDRKLQSYLPFPSPLHKLHTFTHSKETAKQKSVSKYKKLSVNFEHYTVKQRIKR